MKKDVSIIIVNYKTPELTISAVKSVREAMVSDVKYEVIIIDNCSPDDSYEKLSCLENDNTIIIKTDYNGGFGYGNNIGAKRAVGNYLFFLNSDTIMHRAVLEKMLQFMDKNPSIGILSCQMVDGKNNPLVTGHAFESFLTLFIQTIVKPTIPQFVKNYRGRISQRKRNADAFEVDWVSGAALLIKKELFNEVGGWSKEYFMYMEDEDLCLQVKNKGYKVCVYNEVGLIHLVGKSGGSEFVAREKYKSAINFFSKTQKKNIFWIKLLLLVQTWFYVKHLTISNRIKLIKQISSYQF